MKNNSKRQARCKWSKENKEVIVYKNSISTRFSIMFACKFKVCKSYWVLFLYIVNLEINNTIQWLILISNSLSKLAHFLTLFIDFLILFCSLRGRHLDWTSSLCHSKFDAHSSLDRLRWKICNGQNTQLFLMRWVYCFGWINYREKKLSGVKSLFYLIRNDT